ncbi:MAG: hypothetical protein Q7T82_12900 [Armatimonadota bacterium]|nr:hypothetical protein [Armatimonadota bacterium]
MDSKTIRMLFTAVIVVVVGVVQSQTPLAASLKKAKMIQWGDSGPLTYIRDNIREMEKMPFDGLILNLQSNNGAVLSCWNVFVPTPLKAEDYSKDIEALKATKFKKFTDNLLVVDITPGRMDWFDDNFKTAAANAGVMAKIARECRMKGFMFDVEQYEGQIFDYKAQPQKDQHTFAEYQAKARERGREFMRAVNAEFPNIRILMTFSYEVAYGSLPEGGDLSTMPYGLWPSMIDGMLDVAADKTIIYDGFEYSYGLKTEAEYKGAQGFMMVMGHMKTGNVKEYDKHYRSSFGIWTDNGRHWDSVDFTKNYFSPEEFGTALHSALKYSDGYVWVYSEASKWWNWNGLRNVPQPYIDALANARRPRPNPPAARELEPKKEEAPPTK